MSEDAPHERRPAYEPPLRLLRPTPYDPDMPRPAATVAGGVMVLLSAAVTVLMMVDLAAHWRGYAEEALRDLDGIVPSADVFDASLALILAVLGAIALVEAVCGVLILRGGNAARVLVMAVATVSIVTAFVSWWVQGQEITLQTTLLSLAVDILVLLALSSRSAAAYARRREKR